VGAEFKAIQFEAVGDGGICALAEGGDVWRLRGGEWTKIRERSSAVQIVANGDGVVACLDVDGRIMRYAGSEWTQIDKDARNEKIAAGVDGTIYALIDDDGTGTLYEWRGAGWTKTEHGANAVQFDVQ
jgi:hypothetical protein